jgi:hypothetical protein
MEGIEREENPFVCVQAAQSVRRCSPLSPCRTPRTARWIEASRPDTTAQGNPGTERKPVNVAQRQLLRQSREEIVMLRALEVGLVGGNGIRRLALAVVLGVGGALAPLLVRARLKAAKRPERIEVGCLEVGGERYGAVYEDGRLIGVLEGVDRL